MLANQAIHLINQGNANEEAMSLLKQAEIKRGELNFLFVDRIQAAIKKCNPKNPDVMFVKACLVPPGQSAIAYIKECLRAHPNDAHLNRLLAREFIYACGDYNKGLAQINKAIALDSSYPRWLYMRAFCLYNFTKNDRSEATIARAMEAFQECIEANKDPTKFQQFELFTPVYLTLAHLSLIKNDMDNVKAYWDEAMRNEIVWLKEIEDGEGGLRELIGACLKKALYLCGSCETSKPKFRCACLEEAYCGPTCQKAAWKAHKSVCKAKK
jgi:tetratricopeptide (TPR) repeat protein